MEELGRRVEEAMETRALEWGVRLLFVIEGGSRAAGIAHSTSDLDVRFIYARPLRYGAP
jgi:predicted nucleotidyltransferase